MPKILTTHPLTAEQVDALRMLKDEWRNKRRFALIGATAMAIQLPSSRRATKDIDVVVVVPDVSFDSVALNWQRIPGFPHRWRAPNGVEVDILPVGTSDLAPQEIESPGGGRVFNLRGLNKALLQAIPFVVEPGLDVEVASLPVIALLKMISFEDRPADRERDLGDVARIFDEWLEADDERLFDASVPTEVPHEMRAAYLLGVEIGRFVDPDEEAIIEAWCARLRRDDDASGARAKMLSAAPMAWKDGMDGRLDAFERGLRAEPREGRLGVEGEE